MENAKPPRGGFVFEPPAEWPGDIIVPETYKDARAALVDAEYARSRNLQEKQWKALRIGAHPKMLLFTNLFCAKMQKLQIPVYASEIVRTPERQAQLFRDGFSKAKGTKAPHPYGCASDIIHAKLGWNLTQKQWEFFGAIGKELAIQRGIAITWGGDWPPLKEGVGWDPAHWQLKNWKQEMSGFPFMPEGGN